jgi:hypothetical protein
MSRVSGCQWNRQRDGRRGDEAVCLCERDAGSRVVPSPPAGELAVSAIDLDDLQTIEQLVSSRPFVRPKAAMDFLNVDCRRARHARLAPQRSQLLDRARSATQYVDQDRRIQKDWQGSTDAAAVNRALAADPGARIGVPFVLDLSHATNGRFDVVPASLIVQRLAHRGGDERASATRTNA